ncbi:MAG TPA: MBL fold metallo-hydrolase [Gemmatimonadaceae bacterium]|nr:MBL fold metallo-hydrolase [Gemmatimonadaceae bacterium]
MTPPAPHVQSLRLGRWRIHAIQAGGMRLDGGAMFGVVPKPLWERRIQPDARNRIPMGMRCLLIEHDAGPVLIDTGAGNKEDAKFHDIYAIENGGDPGPTALEDGLRTAAGIAPADVRLVLNTHLHFDHAGGNTRRTPDERVVPSFPHARYVVQRGEYEFATHTNERTAGSYFPPNYVPIHEAGLFDFVEGETQILPGIRLLPTPGHVPFHQSILLESDGERALFLADLIPTTTHLPLPWIMGYDVEPLVTLETKRRILRRAAEERWLLIFEHDARVAWGRVAGEEKGKGYRLEGE